MEERIKRIEELQAQLNKEIELLKSEETNKKQSPMYDSIFEAKWRDCKSCMRWKRILDVMQHLDWTYGVAMTIEELQKTAYGVLRRVYDDFRQERLLYENDNEYLRCTCSTGGFEATAEEDEGKLLLSLRFVIDGWDDLGEDE